MRPNRTRRPSTLGADTTDHAELSLTLLQLMPVREEVLIGTDKTRQVIERSWKADKTLEEQYQIWPGIAESGLYSQSVGHATWASGFSLWGEPQSGGTQPTAHSESLRAPSEDQGTIARRSGPCPRMTLGQNPKTKKGCFALNLHPQRPEAYAPSIRRAAMPFDLDFVRSKLTKPCLPRSIGNGHWQTLSVPACLTAPG